MLLQILDVLAAHFGLWVNSKTANEEFRWGATLCCIHVRCNVVISVSQLFNCFLFILLILYMRR